MIRYYFLDDADSRSHLLKDAGFVQHSDTDYCSDNRSVWNPTSELLRIPPQLERKIYKTTVVEHIAHHKLSEGHVDGHIASCHECIPTTFSIQNKWGSKGEPIQIMAIRIDGIVAVATLRNLYDKIRCGEGLEFLTRPGREAIRVKYI